jgi:probable aminopeptidase NPEPL1
MAKTHVPAKGDTQLFLVVESKAEAYSAGLAAAKNWPIYNQKTGKSKSVSRYVNVIYNII